MVPILFKFLRLDVLSALNNRFLFVFCWSGRFFMYDPVWSGLVYSGLVWSGSTREDGKGRNWAKLRHTTQTPAAAPPSPDR